MSRSFGDLELGFRVGGECLFVSQSFFSFLSADLEHFGFGKALSDKFDSLFVFNDKYHCMEEYEPGFFDENDALVFSGSDLVNIFSSVLSFIKDHKDCLTDFSFCFDERDLFSEFFIIKGKVWEFSSNKYSVRAVRQSSLFSCIGSLFFSEYFSGEQYVMTFRDRCVVDAKDVDGNAVKISIDAVSLGEKYVKELERLIALFRKGEVSVFLR